MCIFFFKKKTAYEVRMSDWSSDVCSSDLARRARNAEHGHALDLAEPVVERVADAVEQRRGILGDIPFVERDDQRAAFLQHLVGDAQILRLQPLGRIEQQHEDLREVDRVQRLPYPQFLQYVDTPGALAPPLG